MSSIVANPLLVALFVSLGQLCVPDVARACGFHDCPMGGPRSGVAAPSEHGSAEPVEASSWGIHELSVSLNTALLSFAHDRNALEGVIIEEGLAFAVSVHPKLSLGLSAGYQWVTPDDKRWPGEAVKGFANPLASAQIEVWTSSEWALAADLQVEIPIGSKYVGVAEEHWEAFPYVSVSWTAQGWQVTGSLGYRESFSDHTHGVDDDHPANASLVGVYVDPHAAKEWLARVELGWESSNEEIGFATFIDTMLPTQEDDLSSYFELGASVTMSISKHFAFETSVGRAVFGEVLRAPWRSGIAILYTL